MRHLIDPLDITMEESLRLMDLADRICQNPAAYQDVAARKKLATLFYEPSTRTRLSFEAAMLNLGGKVLGFPDAGVSSATKGETVADTIRVISCYADIAAMRHPKEGAPLRASRYSRVPVTTAGDGGHSHPTQTLLDMLTIRRCKGGFEGLKVAIVGDILHSRVARSDLWALQKLGAKVTFCGLRTLLPRDIEQVGNLEVTQDVREALEGADVVIALRIQLERQAAGLFPSLGEYARVSGLNPKNIRLAKKDVIVMHPGPVNRGVELSSALMDSGVSQITGQVTNGASVRMAVLDLLINHREGR